MLSTKWRPENGNFPAISNFSSMIDNFFGGEGNFTKNFWNGQSTLPAVNIVDNKNNYTIEVAAPGMDKKDFNVRVKNGVLLITSETKSEKEEKNENYSRKEFSYRSFNRSFWLPENVKPEAIKASYKDGILSINLPKTKKKTIESVKPIKVT